MSLARSRLLLGMVSLLPWHGFAFFLQAWLAEICNPLPREKLSLPPDFTESYPEAADLLFPSPIEKIFPSPDKNKNILSIILFRFFN